MKGIILAGGSGTRLYPITKAISKQLVPIYDKPMIYYPLSVLMLAEIRDILIITTKEDQSAFKRLLGDGTEFGINIEYVVQPSPDGLAQAFILGEEFIGDDECVMILGDNIFFGSRLKKLLMKSRKQAEEGKATIFGYPVKDPNRFGIMEINKDKEVISVEEKPEYPKSNLAITGLYFYPKGVSKMAREVKPSARGEFEITTLNDMYLKKGVLKAQLLDVYDTWFDTGTFESLHKAVNLIESIQNQSATLICSPHLIGYENKFLTVEELRKSAEIMGKNSYGQYLKSILERDNK